MMPIKSVNNKKNSKYFHVSLVIFENASFCLLLLSPAMNLNEELEN